MLASLSLEAGGRGLAYGTNVLTQLSGANAAHAPLLKRAVQWLVNGDPGAATAKDFKVSVVGVDKTATQRPEERRPATGGRRLQRADRRQLRQHQQIAGTGQRRQRR